MMRVEQRPIVTGVRQQGYVEILEGVRPGERLVADGLSKVQPGQMVRVSPRPSIIPAAGGNGGHDDAATPGARPGGRPGAGPGGPGGMRPGMHPGGMRPGAPGSPPAGARPTGQRPAA